MKKNIVLSIFEKHKAQAKKLKTLIIITIIELFIVMAMSGWVFSILWLSPLLNIILLFEKVDTDEAKKSASDADSN